VAGEADYDALIQTLATITVRHKDLIDDFTTPVFDGDLLFFTAAADNHQFITQWPPYVRGHIDEHEIPCKHRDMSLPEHATEICARISSALDKIQHSEPEVLLANTRAGQL
jgi:thioesterase domain-containing protein